MAGLQRLDPVDEGYKNQLANIYAGNVPTPIPGGTVSTPSTGLNVPSPNTGTATINPLPSDVTNFGNDATTPTGGIRALFKRKIGSQIGGNTTTTGDTVAKDVHTKTVAGDTNTTTKRPPDIAEEVQTTNEMIFDETLKPYSGLPPEYRDQLLQSIMPTLTSGIQNLESNIDLYTQNALNTYRQEFDNYIKTEIPKQIGKLANRGILSSSVAENTMSQTYSDAVRRSSGMGYQTAMEAAKMKADIPQTIGQLLGYAQYSEDPTVMSGILASLLRGEMPS